MTDGVGWSSLPPPPPPPRPLSPYQVLARKPMVTPIVSLLLILDIIGCAGQLGDMVGTLITGHPSGSSQFGGTLILVVGGQFLVVLVARARADDEHAIAPPPSGSIWLQRAFQDSRRYRQANARAIRRLCDVALWPATNRLVDLALVAVFAFCVVTAVAWHAAGPACDERASTVTTVDIGQVRCVSRARLDRSDAAIERAVDAFLFTFLAMQARVLAGEAALRRRGVAGIPAAGTGPDPIGPFGGGTF